MSVPVDNKERLVVGFITVPSICTDNVCLYRLHWGDLPSPPCSRYPLAGVSPELAWVGGPIRGLGVGGWCDPPGFKGTQRLFRVRTHTLKVRGLTGSLRWGVPLCLLWSLQINEGFPMAGTAIIGSLAEALNLLIFSPVSLFLSHCFPLHFRLSSPLFLSGHLCFSSFSAFASLFPLQPPLSLSR